MPGTRAAEPGGHLSAERIQEAFSALSDRLAARSIRANIYIVGGAAILLAHERDRVTADIDALSIDPHDTVT